MIDQQELTEFERGLLESIAQAKRGEFATVRAQGKRSRLADARQ